MSTPGIAAISSAAAAPRGSSTCRMMAVRAFCSAKRGTSGSARTAKRSCASPSATPRVPSGQYLAASSTALACSTDDTIGTMTPSAPVSSARDM